MIFSLSHSCLNFCELIIPQPIAQAHPYKCRGALSPIVFVILFTLMKKVALLFVILICFIRGLHGNASGSILVKSIQELNSAYQNGELGSHFDFDCVILLHRHKPQGQLEVTDGIRTAILINHSAISSQTLRFGDRIRVSGVITTLKLYGVPEIYNVCSNITVISKNQIPSPRLQTAQDLLHRKPDNLPVRVEGVVVDACADDVHAKFATIVLDCNGEKLYVAIERQDEKQFDFSAILGSTVSITGIHSDASESLRQTMKNVICVDSLDHIKILKAPAPDNVTPAHNVEDFQFLCKETQTNPTRNYAIGSVIAKWGNDNLLIRTDSGKLVKGEIQQGKKPPYGAHIRLTGFPETDLYTPILIRATWQLAGNGILSKPAAVNVSASTLHTDDFGCKQFNFRYYGRRVRLKGTVMGMPIKNGDGILYLEDLGHVVIVDASENQTFPDDLCIGCTVEILGTCVMDTEKMTFNRVMPRINGYRIVIQGPEDIHILSKPSWWTTGRLVALVISLLTFILGIALWNFTLRNTVAKRSKQLESEIKNNIESKLKVYERTRLAVELHDTLSQYLTSVAMQIRTAGIVTKGNPAAAGTHLSLAAKTIDSCRNELRNCLWDLRNLTLDETDIDVAIRKTLAPHLETTALTVRFNVPRERLSDNTTHTILSVIRELVLNAVHHGNASSVKVAGSIEGSKLLFSVRDNGCGFVPEEAPGMAQGHFGLQGIQDRVKAFEGETSIVSTPGRGTKVTISLHIPTSNGERTNE